MKWRRLLPLGSILALCGCQSAPPVSLLHVQLPAAASAGDWAFLVSEAGIVSVRRPPAAPVELLALPPTRNGAPVPGHWSSIKNLLVWRSEDEGLGLIFTFNTLRASVDVQARQELRLSFRHQPKSSEFHLSPGVWLGEELVMKPSSTPEPILTFVGQSDPAQVQSDLPFLSLEGPEEDLRALNSMVQAVQLSPPLKLPSGPFGATSDRFDHHIFWDDDLWIFPALAFLNPAAAGRISAFRITTADQAAINFAHSFPGESGGLQFPWEADSEGREASPTETKREIHISASIARSLAWAASLELASSSDVERIGRGVATFYRHRIEPGGHMSHVLGADEWRTVDDDLYSNMAADWALKTYLPGRNTQVVFPRDQVGYLTFTGDEVGQYQQASALLTLFPLQHPQAEKEAEQMWRRYKDRTSPHGPLMSDSLHALIGARLGFPDEAYGYWRRSWQPGGDYPGFSLPEKTKGEVLFLTGLAGSVNSVIYGFLGMRIDDHEPQKVGWKKPLKSGSWLSITPHLPKRWSSISFKNCPILGEKFDVKATHAGLSVQPARKGPG